MPPEDDFNSWQMDNTTFFVGQPHPPDTTKASPGEYNDQSPPCLADRTGGSEASCSQDSASSSGSDRDQQPSDTDNSSSRNGSTWTQDNTYGHQGPIGPVLYVASIPFSYTDRDLFCICHPFGEIVQAKVITTGTGASKGYGFVTFRRAEDANRCRLTLAGAWCGPRKLRVKFASRNQNLGLSINQGLSSQQGEVQSPPSNTLLIPPLPESAPLMDLPSHFLLPLNHPPPLRPVIPHVPPGRFSLVPPIPDLSPTNIAGQVHAQATAPGANVPTTSATPDSGVPPQGFIMVPAPVFSMLYQVYSEVLSRQATEFRLIADELARRGARRRFQPY